MQLLTVELPKDHNLFLAGDQHLGSALSSKDGWEQFVHTVQSKYDGCRNNFWIDGGDAIEAITVDDKRFDARMFTQPLPLEQMDQAIEARKPIAKQLLAMLQGNHEEKLWRTGAITEKMAEKLGVEYGTQTIKLTVVDGKGEVRYKLFETHGSRSVTSAADDPLRREANMRLTLKRQLKFKAADCAVMVKHHIHKLLVAPPMQELFLTDNGEHIEQGYTRGVQGGDYIHPDLRWYGAAGSFMKLYGEGYSGYAERFEYDPVELGFLCLKVRDYQIVALEPVQLDI